MSSARVKIGQRDESVTSGSLALDIRGDWTAVVEFAGEAALTEGAEVSLELVRESGTVDAFAGRVQHSALDDGALRVSATIVGALGLRATLEARDHAAGVTELSAGLVARAICDAAGVQLADGVEAELDALTLPHWARAEGTGRAALDLLAEVLGLGWRVLQSGRVWIGSETWPTATEPRATGYALDDGGVRYPVDGAEVLPGTTVGWRRIVRAAYLLGGPLRCEARQDIAGDPPRVADRSAYLRAYGARVVVCDAATGLLELVPDEPAMGSADASLRGVPLRVGIPGARCVVPVDARVRLAFDGADPRYPYATALDQDPAATAAFALVGDSCGYLAGYTAAGPVTFVLSATETGAPGETHLTVRGPGHKYAKGVPG